jgi:hypothetical protein
MSSEPVEDLGKIIARPPFGDFVADDMIDMNSFGANLEPSRRDILIRSKLRCGQAPTRHDLVVLGKHIFDGHVPIGKCQQQFLNELLHRSETFDGLKSGCKIYEIFCEYVVEFVEPARVGGVMIAMKQFERLLIVHVAVPPFSSDIGASAPITRLRSIGDYDLNLSIDYVTNA